MFAILLLTLTKTFQKNETHFDLIVAVVVVVAFAVSHFFDFHFTIIDSSNRYSIGIALTVKPAIGYTTVVTTFSRLMSNNIGFFLIINPII